MVPWGLLFSMVSASFPVSDGYILKLKKLPTDIFAFSVESISNKGFLSFAQKSRVLRASQRYQRHPRDGHRVSDD